MRPVPLDSEEWGDHFQKIVVSAPDGDLTSDDIRPVEALVGPVRFGEEIIPAFHIKVLIEKEDLEKIARGEHHFWLILYGSRLQPFAVEMR